MRHGVQVLGPGSRSVIWVQGCHFACPGCIVPESWDVLGGSAHTVPELVAWALGCEDLDGLTLSGGEPFLQAAALCQLIDCVRAQRETGIVCYTGYKYEFLARSGTEEQKDLLRRIDLLIDGPYIQSLQASLLWRGSSNQRLICLSDRYAGEVRSSPDVSAGMQVFVDADGSFQPVGVPPEPGWRQTFKARLSEKGLTWEGDRPPAAETKIAE